eukprot:563813-Rhodomonas_salina.1
MSPERLLGLDCGFPSDVWSLGILTLELTLGRLPYDMSEFAGPNALFEFKKRVVTEPSPHLRRGAAWLANPRNQTRGHTVLAHGMQRLCCASDLAQRWSERCAVALQSAALTSGLSRAGEEQSDDLRHFVDSCLHKNLKLRLSIRSAPTLPLPLPVAMKRCGEAWAVRCCLG